MNLTEIYNTVDYMKPTHPATITIVDKRFPDLRKLLKTAGYTQDKTQSQLNQGRKDDLFSNAFVYEKNDDSIFIRPNSGQVLNFDDYQWMPWLDHPSLFEIADNMGLLNVTSTSNGSQVSLNDKAFRRLNLELFGQP